jgi:hypothetical protein
MLAHIVLGRRCLTYWWWDGRSHRWASKGWRTRDAVIRAVVKAGFGRYEFEGKVVPL